jgi:hypothetical protein
MERTGEWTAPSNITVCIPSLMDCGSTACLLSTRHADNAGYNALRETSRVSIGLIDGSDTTALGEIPEGRLDIVLKAGTQDATLRAAEFVLTNSHVYDALLGTDFLNQINATLAVNAMGTPFLEYTQSIVRGPRRADDYHVRKRVQLKCHSISDDTYQLIM